MEFDKEGNLEDIEKFILEKFSDRIKFNGIEKYLLKDNPFPNLQKSFKIQKLKFFTGEPIFETSKDDSLLRIVRLAEAGLLYKDFLAETCSNSLLKKLRNIKKFCNKNKISYFDLPNEEILIFENLAFLFIQKQNHEVMKDLIYDSLSIKNGKSGKFLDFKIIYKRKTIFFHYTEYLNFFKKILNPLIEYETRRKYFKKFFRCINKDDFMLILYLIFKREHYYSRFLTRLKQTKEYKSLLNTKNSTHCGDLLDFYQSKKFILRATCQEKTGEGFEYFYTRPPCEKRNFILKDYYQQNISLF